MVIFGVDNMQEVLSSIEQVAKHAGDLLISATNICALKSKKGHANYVTLYDQMIQSMIIKELSQQYPGSHFIGEEDEYRDNTIRSKEGFVFIIDPIDGTTNFMQGLQPFVTSIGVLKEGKPFAGVVYNPSQDLMFSAQIGCGAFENGKRIYSSKRALADSITIMGTATYYPDLHKQAFELGLKYLNRSLDIRRNGCAAWDICMVANGNAGLYFEPRLSPWDYAAGAVILQEANGVITTFQGDSLDFYKKSSVIAVSEGVSGTLYLPGQI